MAPKRYAVSRRLGERGGTRPVLVSATGYRLVNMQHADDDSLAGLSSRVDEWIRAIHAGMPRTAVVAVRARHQLSDEVPVGLLLELRLPLLAGPVPHDAPHRVLRFLDEVSVDRLVSLPMRADLCKLTAAGLALSEAGRALLTDLMSAYDTWLGACWRGNRQELATIHQVMSHLTEARGSPDGVFSLWRPVLAADHLVYAGAWNIGTSFRYLRADAHAEAWRSLGVPVGPGLAERPEPERRAAEQRTDERMAAWLPRLGPDTRANIVSSMAVLYEKLGSTAPDPQATHSANGVRPT